MKKKISSVKTGKKLSEKLFSVLLINLTNYSFPFKNPLTKDVLWNLESDICKPLKGNVEKGNIFR